jgi:hypothetical protein
MATTKKITANGTEISVLLQGNENDYICLTDMARYKDKQRTDYIIQNWLRSRSTIEYLVCGSNCTIQILIPSNSMRLEIN